MQVIQMIPQQINRSIPPFIGIAGSNERGGNNVRLQDRVGAVPLYTEADILRFSEITIGMNVFFILRTKDGKKYINLQEFYEDDNKEKLLRE